MDGNHEDGRFGAHVLSGLFRSSMRQEGRGRRDSNSKLARKIPMHVQNKEMFGNDPFKNNFREADLGWLAD